MGSKFPPASDVCLTCGTSIAGRPAQARYCSERCRHAVNHRKWTQKQQIARVESPSLATCASPLCVEVFVVSKKRWRTCSRTCALIWTAARDGRGAAESKAISLEVLVASRIWIDKCPRCPNLVVRRFRSRAVLCAGCRQISHKGIDARKNHARRTSGSVLSVGELAARDGKRCHICRRLIDIGLSGSHRNGPTIEHILPVSKGGTNEPGNLALAHRSCNVSRGNRGHSQLLLTA